MHLRVQKTIQGYHEGLISEEAALDRLEDWLSNFDQKLRSDAIRGLVTLGGGGAADILMNYLQRCAWRDSRLEIIRALGSFRDNEAVLPVLSRWAFETDIEIGQEAVLALGNLGLKGAVEVLLHVLQHEPSQKKLQAVYGLGKLGSPRSVGALIDELSGRGEESPLLTETILLSLTDSRAHEAVDVIRAFVRSLVPGIRHAAITGLGKLAIPDDEVERLLVPLADDLDILTRNLVSWALSTIRSRLRREPWELVEDVALETEPLVRLSLIRDLRIHDQQVVVEFLLGQHLCATESLAILAELETPAALSAIVDLLGSTADDSVAHQAARHLSHLGVGDDVERVMEIRDSTTITGVRGLLTTALALTCPDEGPHILLGHLPFDDLDSQDVAWMVRGLGRMAAAWTHDIPRRHELIAGLERVLETVTRDDVLRAFFDLIRQVLSDDERSPCGLAELSRRVDVASSWRHRALAALGTREAAAQLIGEFLVETDPGRLVNLAELIGELGLPSLPCTFVPRVEELLRDGDPRLQESCLHMLGRVKPPGAWLLIRPFLARDDYRILQSAVIAAGCVQDRQSVEPLAELLEEADRRIQGRTLHALSQIGGDDASRVMMEFLARHPWDDEFGDKVLRSVQLPSEDSSFDEFVRLLETFEERTGSETLRERANRFKLNILDASLRYDHRLETPTDDDVRRVMDFLGIEETGGEVIGGAIVRARAVRSADDLLLYGLVQCCTALDEATELAMGPLFRRMRERGLVYTVLENVGFAGRRSNAIDRSFFLDSIHAIPAVRQLRHFPDPILEECLDILYSNQLHRELLLGGFQRWALMMLVFGRRYRFERFEIPDLLGIPCSDDGRKIRLCCELLSLHDKRLRTTSPIQPISGDFYDSFLERTEFVVSELSHVFQWNEEREV